MLEPNDIQAGADYVLETSSIFYMHGITIFASPLLLRTRTFYFLYLVEVQNP